MSLRWALAAGIVLRCIVFCFLSPFNADDHYAVVHETARHWRAVPAYTVAETKWGPRELSQAYQPPLYYLLAAPFDRLGGAKAVQFLSLLMSIATLAVLYRLLGDERVIADGRIGALCLWMAALMPQFVCFGLHISSDTLAMLMGAVMFWQVLRYLRDPGWKNLCLLGLVAGVGWLAKWTFMTFAPVLAVMVLVVEWRRSDMARGLTRATVFGLIFLVIGGYKPIDNMVRFGRPLAYILESDAYWIREQKGVWAGAGTMVDFNLVKLLYWPRYNGETKHSWPLLLYGTTWYQHLRESNFNSRFSERFIAPAIYLMALVPTGLMIVGWLASLSGVGGRVRPPYGVAAWLLLMNLLIVLVSGYRDDLWSSFQGRQVFPAFVGMMLALAAGLEIAPHRVRGLLTGALVVLYALFVAYFVVEIVDVIRLG